MASKAFKPVYNLVSTCYHRHGDARLEYYWSPTAAQQEMINQCQQLELAGIRRENWKHFIGFEQYQYWQQLRAAYAATMRYLWQESYDSRNGQRLDSLLEYLP